MMGRFQITDDMYETYEEYYYGKVDYETYEECKQETSQRIEQLEIENEELKEEVENLRKINFKQSYQISNLKTELKDAKRIIEMFKEELKGEKYGTKKV